MEETDNTRRLLNIDIETFSSVDLIRCGVYAYVESPDFEVQIFGYSWGDEDEVHVVDLAQGEEIPVEILEALESPTILKTAFNANFERVCLSRHLGKRLPLDQWDCTAVRSRQLGLPGNLAGAGQVLNVGADKQKDQSGRALIRFFAKPCRPTKANGLRTRNLPEHDIKRWNQYLEYNRQDVLAEKEVRRILTRFPVNIEERPLWLLDQEINDRGVEVDLEFAENAIAFDNELTDRKMQQAKELTGLENPNSVMQLREWIEMRTGVEVESLAKAKIPELREQIDDEVVHQMLDLREDLSMTSTSKYEAMTRAVNSDSRIRGLTMFYGASRTGRWAGRRVQLQNLRRNSMPDRDLDVARRLVKAGDLATMEMLFDDVPDALSQLIRTALVPKEGYEYIVADFSAIEARILAWLADEEWRMKVFKSHGKIYEASAEHMFDLPEGSVGRDDPMRDKGKIAELALGYGGTTGALKAMGALNMGLEEHELRPLVNTWRRANQRITDFWWRCDRAMREVIRHKTRVDLPHGVSFYMHGPLMRIELPSGRMLSYVRPGFKGRNMYFWGQVQTTGQWAKVDTYGPKLAENITQAIARDCLAEGLLRLDAKGIPIVFHVHDEIIVEVPKGKYTPDEIGGIMAAEIEWAPGLPMGADAYACDYYMKD